MVIHRVTQVQLSLNRRPPTISNFFRSISGNRLHRMPTGRISTASQRCVPVVTELGQDQMRHDLKTHWAVCEGVKFGLHNTLPHRGQIQQKAQRVQQRVGAIDYSQPGVFVGPNVGHNVDPSAPQDCSVSGFSQAIFQHPLPECFGTQRRVVVKSQFFCSVRAVASSRCGRNAVHHAAGKGAGR